MTKAVTPSKRAKPGPAPEHLKIEEDPSEALRKLLTKAPPEDGEDREGAEEPQDGESS